MVIAQGMRPPTGLRGRPSGWERLARVLALGMALGVTTATFAQAEPTAADKETARALLDQGDAAYKASNFSEALQRYGAAHAIMNVPTTGIEVAKAQEALGKLVEARDTLLEVARFPKKPNEPQAFSKARERAQTHAAEIAARIPAIRIQVTGLPSGTTPAVTIDGAEVNPAILGVPRKLNPGKHVITASASGYAEARREVEVAERAELDVPLELTPSAAAPAPVPAPVPATEAPAKPSSPPPAATDAKADTTSGSSTSSLAYIGFGVAAVGLTVGGITGALAFSKAGTASDQCTNNVCPPAAQADIDSSKTMGTVSTVSFAVGFVGAAIGIYGLMTPSEPEATSTARPTNRIRLQPTVGVGNVGLMGQF